MHRDIKPENILFVDGGENHGDGRIKICDFGTATRFTKGEKLKDFYGCPNYIAPEIL